MIQSGSSLLERIRETQEGYLQETQAGGKEEGGKGTDLSRDPCKENRGRERREHEEEGKRGKGRSSGSGKLSNKLLYSVGAILQLISHKVEPVMRLVEAKSLLTLYYGQVAQ